MALPLAPLENLRPQLFDGNGDPGAGFKLYSYLAGSSTPQSLYTNSIGTVAAANPVELNSAGRPATTLYLPAVGLKLIYTTDSGPDAPVPVPSGGVVIWTDDNIGDVGAIAFNTLGQILAEGSRDVTSGYVIDNDDNTVTVLPDASPDPCVVTLPEAADRGLPLTVILLTSTVDLDLTPDGADTINGVSGPFTITPGTSPLFAGVTLNSDGVSNWTLSAAWGF